MNVSTYGVYNAETEETDEYCERKLYNKYWATYLAEETNGGITNVKEKFEEWKTGTRLQMTPDIPSQQVSQIFYLSHILNLALFVTSCIT